MPDLNWNAVYAFWLVATHGSFAEAARSLPRGSVQALHKRVRRLETKENLGLTLFRSRGVKGVELTDAGRHLMQTLDPIFKSFDVIAGDLRGEASGSLKVAMTRYVSYNFGEALVTAFHHQFPAVSIELLERPMLEVISLAEKGQVDFGLGSPPVGNSPLNVSQTHPIRMEFLAPRGHRLAQGRVTWDEIAKEPLILPERGTMGRWAFDKLMFRRRSSAGPLRIAGEVSSAELALAAVKAGLGLAFVAIGPRLEKHIRGMTRIAPPPGLPRVEVAVYCREDRYMPKFMKAFFDLAIEVLGDSPKNRTR
jgi:DNA-binding transcriptional LysR family regulator